MFELKTTDFLKHNKEVFENPVKCYLNKRVVHEIISKTQI